VKHDVRRAVAMARMLQALHEERRAREPAFNLSMLLHDIHPSDMSAFMLVTAIHFNKALDAMNVETYDARLLDALLASVWWTCKGPVIPLKADLRRTIMITMAKLTRSIT
jgi:hypothetical protein